MYKLQWDSQFWGIEIYSIDKDYDFDISNINHGMSDLKSWLVQALIPEEETQKINILESKGFRFVETKINLEKQVLARVEISNKQFKEIKHEDIKEYKNHFYDLFGQVSRFSSFNKKKINDYYYTWVNNSINQEMDDKCIGYYIQDRLAGFVTFRLRNQEISIGLIGVFKEFQRKGIGQKLLNYIDNYALEKSIERINISTQGKNCIAINTYLKNGYFIKNIENWYYLRGDRCD